MWIHVVIFTGIFFVEVAVRRGWIRLPALREKENRKWFLLVALVGNLLGGVLTWQHGGSVALKKGEPLLRAEDGVMYAQTLDAVIGEEELRLSIQVPGQDVEEEKKEEADTLRQQLEGEIILLNTEKENPEYFYLPDELNGVPILWKKPGSTDGALLAALCFLAACAITFLKENEKFRKEEARREQMLLDYPNLVMKLTLLIQAGMTVRSAFRRMAGDYEKRKKKGKERYAYEEMVMTCHEMDSGVSEAVAYEHFAARCGQVKYKTLSTLLVQNLQKGSSRLLEMLERESMEAFEDRKRKARVLGEAAATKLLVPMVMMLGVVLAIIMIPAILSFYG